jgi:hypothetical protein
MEDAGFGRPHAPGSSVPSSAPAHAFPNANGFAAEVWSDGDILSPNGHTFHPPGSRKSRSCDPWSSGIESASSLAMFCQLGTEMPDGKRARVVLPTGVCVAPNWRRKRETKGGTGSSGTPGKWSRRDSEVRGGVAAGSSRATTRPARIGEAKLQGEERCLQ